MFGGYILPRFGRGFLIDDIAAWVELGGSKISGRKPNASAHELFFEDSIPLCFHVDRVGRRLFSTQLLAGRAWSYLNISAECKPRELLLVDSVSNQIARTKWCWLEGARSDWVMRDIVFVSAAASRRNESQVGFVAYLTRQSQEIRQSEGGEREKGRDSVDIGGGRRASLMGNGVCVPYNT